MLCIPIPPSLFKNIILISKEIFSCERMEIQRLTLFLNFGFRWVNQRVQSINCVALTANFYLFHLSFSVVRWQSYPTKEPYILNIFCTLLGAILCPMRVKAQHHCDISYAPIKYTILSNPYEEILKVYIPPHVV